MPQVEENYGTKIGYDPLWKGPIEVKRTARDVPCLILFGIFLILWLGISIYAYSNGDIRALHLQNIKGNDYDGSISINNIVAARMIIIGFGFLAIVLSLAYTILLRWHAKIIVYTALFVISVLLLGVAIAAGCVYAKHDNRTDALAILIVSAITFLILVIFTLLFRKKIDIACEVIRESSKAVMFFPSSLIFPILPYILYLILIVFALSVYTYLSVIPQPTKDTPGHIYSFHFINIFGTLWVGCFIIGFSQMTLSGTFATWYWTMNKNYIPNATLIKFMGTVTRYHLGTLAFGSLIVAICQLINLILQSIRSRLRGNCNALACLLLGWYEFLFGNLERFLKFINRNAYVMSAVHGTGFFQSAKDAFNLLMRNIVKVIVINKVTDAILFLGQLLVVGISVLATYGYCYNEGLDHLAPTAMGMVLIISALISVSFFMVLKTAIDTVFLCVLEDFERNDGSDERPYYMSFKLKQLLLK